MSAGGRLCYVSRERINTGGLKSARGHCVSKEWGLLSDLQRTFWSCAHGGDNSYMGLVAFRFLIWSRRGTTVSPMTLLPMGRTGMPSSSEAGDVRFGSRRCQFSFVKEKTARILTAGMKNFKDGLPIRMKIHLTREPEDSMVIAVPFRENPRGILL